jgi:hypothetical protein
MTNNNTGHMPNSNTPQIPLFSFTLGGLTPWLYKVVRFLSTKDSRDKKVGFGYPYGN